MRAVVQKVKKGSVKINEDKDVREVSSIEKGLVIFLGVSKEDKKEDADYLADKISGLRIFEDENGKMNLSVKDVAGEVIVVSQFTLYGDCRKGRRPSFTQAMAPQEANQLYEYFVEKMSSNDLPVKTGVFQAHMLVNIDNDGPVTLLLDSEKQF